MKTIRFIVLAAAATMLAVACEKAVNEKTAPVESASGTLYATVESPSATRTSMTVGSGSATVSWSTGDIISVFNGVDPNDGSVHTQNACYRLKSVDAGVGSFEFESQNSADANAPLSVDESITPVVAVYRYRGIGTNAYDPAGKIITHRLPATQTYVAGSFDPNAYSMVAVSDGGTLNFKGVVGVLELNLVGTDLIKSIVVEGSNICWNGTIDVSTAEKIAAPVMSMYHTDGSGEDKITYSCGDGVQLSTTPTPFYIVLPVGTHDLTLTINAKHSKMVKTAPNLKIERATITPTANLTYAETSSPVDLSGAGVKIANCYVVSQPGNYVFDAKTPGGTTFTGSDYTADWVWATSGRWNKAEHDKIENLISDIEYIDGKIYFSTAGSLGTYNVGNIIIGIFKDGDLKWSWHIWETLDPKDVTIDTKVFMDRNVGAMREFNGSTSDTDYNNASRGFYYQWGRKDPVVWSRGTAATMSTYGTSVAFDIATNQATRYLSNTTVWAKAGEWSALSAAPSDWTSYSAENALKYPTNMLAQAMMPSVANGDAWPAEANPCPYGYHVMTSAEAQVLIGLGADKWEVTNSGANNASCTFDGKLVLPYQGYRKPGNGQINYNSSGKIPNGKYWISTCTAANKAGYMDIPGGASASAPVKLTNVQTACGMSLRCVKD